MSLVPQIVAYPESAQILRRQVAATVLLSTRWAVLAMVPVLLRVHFGADNFQTLVATVAGPALMSLSIFWGHLYHRLQPERFLWLLWSVAMLPIAGIALCHTANTALVFVVLAAVGSSGMIPVTGDILRGCYSPSLRGRVWGLLNVASLASITAVAYVVGFWLDRNGEAFRIYMPLAVIVQAAGVAILVGITRQPLFIERQRAREPVEPAGELLGPLSQLWRTLRTDKHFLRYELAFMSYGVGWMICAALLPVLVTDKLHLSYTDVAESTQVALQLTMLLTTLPMGYLVDRLGPARMCAAAFAWLAIYPIGLLLAQGAASLTVVTIAYALGMAAMNMGWMLGPVMLAREAAQAPTYIAIHSSLVGLRALFGQPLGMGLYVLSGGFTLPFGLAAATFALGAWGMYLLHRQLRSAAAHQPQPPSTGPGTAPTTTVT
ncbi:MAG: MFS transporter [Phycisphaerae bacterium]